MSWIARGGRFNNDGLCSDCTLQCCCLTGGPQGIAAGEPKGRLVLHTEGGDVCDNAGSVGTPQAVCPPSWMHLRLSLIECHTTCSSACEWETSRQALENSHSETAEQKTFILQSASACVGLKQSLPWSPCKQQTRCWCHHLAVRSISCADACLVLDKAFDIHHPHLEEPQQDLACPHRDDDCSVCIQTPSAAQHCTLPHRIPVHCSTLMHTQDRSQWYGAFQLTLLLGYCLGGFCQWRRHWRR